MRIVYPASWPIPVGAKRLATWLILERGRRLQRRNGTIRLSGPDSFKLSRALSAASNSIMARSSAHLETGAPNLTPEDVAKIVEAKDSSSFRLTPLPLIAVHISENSQILSFRR